MLFLVGSSCNAHQHFTLQHQLLKPTFNFTYISTNTNCTYTDSINVRLDVTQQSIDGDVNVGLGRRTAIQHILVDKLLQRFTQTLKRRWHAKEHHCEISKYHVSRNDVEQIDQQP